MPKSAINSKYEFDENIWVVSVLNTGSKLMGHAILIVEGVTKDSNSLYTELFVGQYDIKATAYEVQNSSFNTTGYVSKVDVRENTKYTRDYSGYQAKSYCADPKKVEEMIFSIKENKTKVEKLQKMIDENVVKEEKIDSVFIKKHGFIEYQLVGKNSLLADEGKGDNCAGWVLEKLAIAGIGDGTGKPSPEKVSGGCVLI